MALPDLRVRYDSPDTLHEMLDWLVDSDPLELRDIARNLLSDVETLKAALAAERAAGRAEYAELAAAARALVDGLGLVRGQSFTATEPMVRLLRAVRGLEAQTKEATDGQ